MNKGARESAFLGFQNRLGQAQDLIGLEIDINIVIGRAGGQARHQQDGACDGVKEPCAN